MKPCETERTSHAKKLPVPPAGRARRRRVRRVGPAPACARSRRAGGGCGLPPRCPAVNPTTRVETEIKKAFGPAIAPASAVSPQIRPCTAHCAHQVRGQTCRTVRPSCMATNRSSPRARWRGSERRLPVFMSLFMRARAGGPMREGRRRATQQTEGLGGPPSLKPEGHPSRTRREGSGKQRQPTRAASQGIPLCFEPLCLLLEEPSHGRETGGTNP